MKGCTKCGRCCSHLREGDKESGLTLFPDEIYLFPEEKIKPHIGKGEFKPTSIFTYQHTENTCIHLDNNLCNIYEERPLMCRSFPIKLGINGLRLSQGCKAVMNILKHSEMIDDEQMELNATKIIVERLSDFHNKLLESEREWKYHLSTETWEPYM